MANLTIQALKDYLVSAGIQKNGMQGINGDEMKTILTDIIDTMHSPKNASGFAGIFDPTDLSASFTYSLPLASGRLALLTDISSKISDTPYGVSWNGVTDIAPSKGAIYNILETISGNVSGLVDDTTYGISWDGVTAVAPSKNAVYDKIESLNSQFANYLPLAGGSMTGNIIFNGANQGISGTAGNYTVNRNNFGTVFGSPTIQDIMYTTLDPTTYAKKETYISSFSSMIYESGSWIYTKTESPTNFTISGRNKPSAGYAYNFTIGTAQGSWSSTSPTSKVVLSLVNNEGDPSLSFFGFQTTFGTNGLARLRTNNITANGGGIDLEMPGFSGTLALVADITTTVTSTYGNLTSYTVATLPSVTGDKKLIYVTDEVGGPVVAYTDQTNWRRISDNAIVA